MKGVGLSDKLYNQGLERLKSGDFFHGIQALTKSVTVNKKNVLARNLLGLALFEVGHTGEAITHWIISQLVQKENNHATRYMEIVHKNTKQIERANEAIEMYNKALSHIKQGSDDLAIIQLKKAVDQSPNFVDALNLLTFCYLIQNERERAAATVERALAIDTVSPIALNYHSLINPNKSRAARTALKAKPTIAAAYKPLGIEEKKQRTFHFSELLTFIIGVACALALCYFLFVPALESAREKEREDAAQHLMNVREQHQANIAKAEEEKTDLNTTIANLHNEMTVYNDELDIQRRVNDVNRAHFLYLDDKLQPAVDILQSFSVYDDLPPDIRQRAETILEDSYPRLGLEYYNVGHSAFNAATRDTYLALTSLENAHRYLTEEALVWNRLLFMLGTLYYDTNEDDRSEDAYRFLNELRERAPSNLPGFTGGERTAFNNMLRDLDARMGGA